MSAEPAWRSLIRQLTDEGYQSPYLERLRRKYDLELRGHAAGHSLEREILEEMAHALGRAEDKVNLALLELELAGKRCDEAGHDRASVEAFHAARDRAIRVRRDLLIHRDALRFPRDPRFEENYPIPPTRAARSTLPGRAKK